MGQELAVTGRKYDGKAMSRLTDGQRLFVINLVEMGAKPKVAMRAAKAAGFHPNYGHELMRDENILSAIREEATKRLAGAALTGVNVLIKIALNDEHRDQFKAAKELAGINGFTAEQRIVVEHVDRDIKEKIKQIRMIAGELGVDANLLIGRAGIVEAEFTEVEDEDPPADGQAEA